MGYKYGFVDAYGSDALLKWNLPAMPLGPEYRWWERENANETSH